MHIQSAQCLWKQGKIQLAHNFPVVVASQKKGRCGHKAVPLDLEQLLHIILKQRMTILDVASKHGISKSRVLGATLVTSNHTSHMLTRRQGRSGVLT